MTRSLAAAALMAFSSLTLAGCDGVEQTPVDETMKDVTIMETQKGRATYVTSDLEYRGNHKGFVFNGPGDLVLKDGLKGRGVLDVHSEGTVVIEGDQMTPINTKGDVVVNGHSLAGITTTGSIIIKGDILGSTSGAILYKAGGNVTVLGGADLASIESGGEVKIAKSVSSLDIAATGDITTGIVHVGVTLNSRQGDVRVNGAAGHTRFSVNDHYFKNAIKAASDITVNGPVSNTDLVAGGKTDVQCYYKIGPAAKLCPQ